MQAKLPNPLLGNGSTKNFFNIIIIKYLIQKFNLNINASQKHTCQKCDLQKEKNEASNIVEEKLCLKKNNDLHLQNVNITPTL